MSHIKAAPSTSLWQVVSNMQEQMEQQGLSQDVVDVIVKRGLEILLGTSDEREDSAHA